MFVIIVADQVTKWWALSQLTPGVSLELLGRFAMFTLVYNEGGAMGTNLGSSTYYLISSVLILLFVLYYTYTHHANKRLAIPLACVAGGAVGNIIDRIRVGSVVDFIDVDFFDINVFGYRLERWWTFNIADAAISCGIVALVVIALFARQHSPTEGAAQN